VQIKINLDPEMIRELETASRENQLTPQGFAAECIESVLASRRLPTVRPSTSATRMSRTAETAMLDVPRLTEHRYVGPKDL